MRLCTGSEFRSLCSLAVATLFLEESIGEQLGPCLPTQARAGARVAHAGEERVDEELLTFLLQIQRFIYSVSSEFM